ncbi:3'-5' exonuclease isoform X2 [Hevea brasiliensis]|uniref:3'-5' exonuclease isoform X2 n=1 Tax=Hevea brasiliensis TaxID=3981 RepID=UPI000B77C758|nr:3'-5' exonuclease isoform X2 [Hevea brasiliensis]
MHSQEISNADNNSEIASHSSPSVSVPDWDQPLTEEELQAIDAIEAAFQRSTSANGTPSSSVIRKRRSHPQNDLDMKKTCRQLPNSVLGLCRPFSLSPCQGVLPGKVAVMQLCCGTDYCHVMHIFHSGITETLQFLLENSTLLKVGVGIHNDSVKFFKDYKISVKAVEDLSYLANKKLGGEPKSWGLQSLTEKLISKELQKSNKIRLGNWEVDVLSKNQLEYAATDAFASWQLYQVLKSLPDAKDATAERSEEVRVVTQQ